MDIPEYFNNVVLAQFKATGIPLKVYVNGEYLIITDMYEISDPLIGSGMDEDGNMNQFDYREIDHLLVGGNVIDLATYTKAMAGDTPEQDAKKDEEPKEESIQELTKKEQDLELKSLKLKMDAAKEAMAAAKDKMNQVKKQPTEEAVMEGLDGSFANAQKLLRNSTVVSYEFDRNNNGDWFVLIKYVPMNKEKVEMTVVNMGQDYSMSDLSKIKRQFGLDKPVKKKYKLSNPMSGGQGYGEIFETKHNYTFGVGDIVKNKNTSCPHHGSMGIVQKIMKLANDMGMVVKYRVVNSGPTYNPGDSLVKTMDQLEPVQDPAEVEAPMDENK